MFAIGPRQVDAFGEAGQAEQHTGFALVHARLVLVQRFLLGQIALNQNASAPVPLQPIEDVLHLPARRKQHQRSTGAFHQLRQLADDGGGVRRRVTRVSLQIRHPELAGIGMMKGARHHGSDRRLGQAGSHPVTIEAVQRRERS